MVTIGDEQHEIIKGTINSHPWNNEQALREMGSTTYDINTFKTKSGDAVLFHTTTKEAAKSILEAGP